MIFIPKYPIIEARQVSEDLQTFEKQLASLNITYGEIVSDRQSINSRIVAGYSVKSKSGNKSVFVPIGSIIFKNDNVLNIIEDEDAFFELYEKCKEKTEDRVAINPPKTKSFINPPKTKVSSEQKFVCPQCGYISDTQFTECPNCGCTSESCKNLQSVSKTNFHKKKKEKTMTIENANNDLLKAREEAQLENKQNPSEVTAVYGDVVTSEEKVEGNNK